MKRRRLLIWLGGSAALVLVCLLLGALLLPWLIDSQLVKEKIAATLAGKTQGKVTLGKIDLLWFPRPTVKIDDIHIFFDKKNQGKIRSARVYPSIIDLLMRRVTVHRAQLERAQVKIHLSAPPQQTFDIDEVEKELRSGLTHMTTELTGLRVELTDGSAEIEIGDRPAVILGNLNAWAAASSEKLRFELSARSNLFDESRVEGEITQVNLAGKFAVKLAKLRLNATRLALAHNLPEFLEDGELNFALELEALGLKKVKAEIDSASGSLVLVGRDGKIKIEPKKLKAHLVYDQRAFQSKVEQLELAQPRLKASGELESRPKASSARIRVRDLDIAQIRGSLLQFADDWPVVKTLFEVVKAGMLPEIIFHSGGGSLAELRLGKNIVVTGVMRNGSLFIPGPGLDLTNVNGSVRIAAGVLEGKDIDARLGTAKGWDGKLRMGLEGRTAPFHLDVAVRTKATELHSILLKLDLGDIFHKEITRVRNITGDLAGRLILGERLDAIAPVISVSNADVTAAYDPIPFPINVNGGRFHYGGGTITLDKLDGSIGKSTVMDLNATLQYDKGRRVKVESGRFSLDLEQIHKLLLGIADLRSRLGKLSSATGKVEITNLSGEGLVSDPANWQFVGAGTVKDVVFAHTDAPGTLTVARGKFTATQEKVTFTETAVGMLDGALTVSGVAERAKEFPLKVDISGRGAMGGQFTRWLSRQADLPKELLLRSPVTITAGRMAWHGASDFSFRGSATAAGGPHISIDASVEPHRLIVRNLTVEDGTRIAHIKANLQQESFDLSFKGVITQQTAKKIFASFPFQGSVIEGDIEISSALKEPVRFSARGHLEGSDLFIPVRNEKARVEKFRVDAMGKSLQIRSADLHWRNRTVAVSGTVIGEKSGLRLNMDVSADRLDWDDLRGFNKSDDDGRKNKGVASAWMNSLHGTIRLKAQNFKFEGYNFSPLRMTVALSPSGIRADIAEGVACGINSAGQIHVRGRELDVDIRLKATEAELEPTMLCLTDKQSDVKGTYSLSARIAGRGEQEKLLSSLKGDFEVSARDGEFVRWSPADATFDYLNATGDFKIAFPDLDKEAFPYRRISIKGRIDGDNLISDEVIIQSTTLTITGQGKVDIRQRQIDAKGLISAAIPANQLIKHIPFIGPLVGGRLIGIPVRVAGSFDRPDVQYLSPEDVGMELMRMPLRILGAPLEAIRLFTPSSDAPSKSKAE